MDFIVLGPSVQPALITFSGIGTAPFPMVPMEVIGFGPPPVLLPFTIGTGSVNGAVAPGSPSNVSDNCDPAPSITFTDVEDLTGCGGTGTITRTWTATDACGNDSMQVQIITVGGNIDLEVLCQDITVQLDEN